MLHVFQSIIHDVLERILRSKGDEIRITYGALSNADLLQYYGFVMPRNPHDHLSIGFADLSVVLLRPAIGSEADRLDRFRVEGLGFRV